MDPDTKKALKDKIVEKMDKFDLQDVKQNSYIR
jgi:hypothetical protein